MESSLVSPGQCPSLNTPGLHENCPRGAHPSPSGRPVTQGLSLHSCLDKAPQTGWLPQWTLTSPQFWKLESSGSRCWQGWFLCCLSPGRLEGGHLLDGASRGLPCVTMSLLPPLIGTPVIMDEGHPMPHFSNYLFKSPLSKYSHVLSS